MSLSDYGEGQVLAYLAANGFLYASLHTGDPTDTAVANEVSGGSYARKAPTWGSPTSPAGTIATTADLTWTSMPATTITNVGLWDAITSGHLWWSGNLGIAQGIGAGGTFKLYAGNLIVAVA